VKLNKLWVSHDGTQYVLVFIQYIDHSSVSYTDVTFYGHITLYNTVFIKTKNKTIKFN